MIGNDGAAFSQHQRGSVFFVDSGFVTTGWRPPKYVRKGLLAGDWAAWHATLTHVEAGIKLAREIDGVDE